MKPNPALWGAVIVSTITMLGFCGVTFAIFTDHVPIANKEQLASIIFGGWLSLATGVVGYWIGSSVGSLQKTATLSEMAKKP